MFEDVFETNAVPWPGFEAFVDKIDERRRFGRGKHAEFALNGIFFFAKGGVAVEHVVEQKTQGPDGGALGAEFVVLEELVGKNGNVVGLKRLLARNGRGRSGTKEWKEKR